MATPLLGGAKRQGDARGKKVGARDGGRVEGNFIFF